MPGASGEFLCYTQGKEWVPSQATETCLEGGVRILSRLCHLASSLGDVLAKWTQSVVVPNVVHPKIGDTRHLAQLELGARRICHHILKH